MEVFRLDHAHIRSKESILFETGKENVSRMIGCFSWLIHDKAEWILIDCGIEDIDTVNKTKTSKDDWSRTETEGNLQCNLKWKGISADKISKVYLTHSHYDHLSGILHLENATIYMAVKEYEYLLNDNPHKSYLLEAVKFLQKKQKEGKLVLIRENEKIGNAQCWIVGAHTPGSMMIQFGKYLFTGDAVFLLENVEKGIPVGFCINQEETMEAMLFCRKHNGLILTGHDLKCPKMIQ